MNVIRQPKRGGGGNSSVGNRPFAVGPQKSKGRGRGALDFDIIQYRPGQRAEAANSASSSGGIRTPSNLELKMAISSSAYRNPSSSSHSPSNNMCSPSVFAFGQSLRGKPNHLRRSTSSSSSSFVTPKYSVMGPPKTPRNTSMIVSSTPRTTPTSTSTGGDQRSSHVILAITEGRGHARGEVGIAVIDVKRPRLILCQLSDRQTYANTLTKICVFQPVEILIPHTFVDSNQQNKLYNLLEEKFPHVSMTKVQRRLFRDSEGLEKVQYLCLPENSSCQLILQDRFYALAATAALLKYVEFVQNVIFAAHSLKVEYQGAHHGTIIDVKTAKNLELLLNQQSNNAAHTLVSVMDHCCTHGGSRLLRASLLHPPCSLPSITRRQDGVQELVENPDIIQKIREALNQLPDVEQLLTLCMQTPSNIDNNQAMETRVNYVLMLKTALETLPHLATALDKAKSFVLSKAKECLQDPRADLIKARILQTINEDVKAPKGGKTANFQRCFAIKNGISDLMDVARKTYCELVNDMHDHVTDLGSNHSLPVKMNYSVTKGYHVQIPIQRNHPIKKSDLPSLFVQVQHNRNFLTCTTEILIHANERIKEVTAEIMTMSNTVLTVVLNDIRSHISYLYGMCESIAEVDLHLSLAQISSSHNYVRPKFGDSLSLKASRHPILESITTCEPIANNIEATGWQNLSIITGPNMSGKSIYIKQVLLLQIMAQVGCYVPAEEANFRITDHIFSHLNFDDSIENNASTLALEMQEMQFILSSVTATSVVAIDELCRGTSVEEGTAIAWALCEELNQSTAFVFVTTHFRELTKLASLYPSIKNIHLETIEKEFSDKKSRLVYTHRLLPGVNPVEGYGLRLAESLDMPESILNLASSFASRIRNISETCLISTQGDEGYIRALAFHKLKALADKEDLNVEDLLAMQSELKEKLKIAQEQKIRSIKTQETEKRASIKKSINFTAHGPSQSATMEEQVEANVHVAFRDSQKLCAYSSSDDDATFTPHWTESSQRKNLESIHSSSPSSSRSFKNVERMDSSCKNTVFNSSRDYESGRMSPSGSDDLNDSPTSASENGNITITSSPGSLMNSPSCSSLATWRAESPVSGPRTDPIPENAIEKYSKRQFSDLSVSDYCDISPRSDYSRSASRNSPPFHTSCMSSEVQINSPECKTELKNHESFSSFHLNLPCPPGRIQETNGPDFNLLQDHGEETSSPQSKFNFFAPSSSEEEDDTNSFFPHDKDDDPPEHLPLTPEIFCSNQNSHGIKILTDGSNFDSFSPILGSRMSNPQLRKGKLKRKIELPLMFSSEKSAFLSQSEEISSRQEALGPKLVPDNPDSTRNMEEEPKVPLNSLKSIMESYDYSDSDSN